MQVFFKALFTACCILVVFVVDPLGIRVSAEKHYEDHILRLTSPFFHDSVSDKVTVVLLDDAFLAQTGRYPVSYNNLTRLLKVLNHHQPQAIFFDILQYHEHSERLSRWIKTLANSRAPVYMASDPEHDTQPRLSDPSSLRFKLSEVTRFAAVSWSGVKHYYPMEVSHEGISTPTVAPALYRVYCQNAPSKCTGIDHPDSVTSSMIVQWSNKYDKRQNEYLFLGDRCAIKERSNIAAMWATLSGLLTQGIKSSEELDSRLRTECPPTLTLSAVSLFAPGAINSPKLTEALSGKIVMVGYNLSGGADLVESPVHGKLPGVFNHAMALENLIIKGGEYWHVPEDIGIYNLSIADIIEIAIQITALFCVIWYRYVHLEQATGEGNALSGLWPVLIIATLILISVLISHLSLALGVANWYALPLILMLDLPIFLYFLLESLKKRVHRIHTKAVRTSRVRYRLVKRNLKRKHTTVFKEET